MKLILILLTIFSASLNGIAALEKAGFRSESEEFMKSSAEGVKPITYFLVSGKKSDYRIALDPLASDSEQWAAKELQHWIKEISGAELPIQTIDQPFTGPQIILGYNIILKEKTGTDPIPDLDESFRYRS